MPSVRGLPSLVSGALAALAAGRRVQVAGVSESLAELVVLTLARRAARKKLVLVLPHPKELTPWTQFLEHTLPEVVPEARSAILPFFSLYGNDRFINPSLARKQRLYAIAALADPTRPAVIATTLPALAQATLAPSELVPHLFTVKTGQELDPDRFIAVLEDLGYAPHASVEEEGQYALRGGIVDVFPVNRDLPLRIEFLGDDVASMREFVLADQKSRTTLAEATIAPAYEALTPASSRKGDAQKLYEILMELKDLHPADRDGMVSAFLQGARFAGFDMFSPLFRAAPACALDYLDAGDSLLVFPKGLEACTEHYTDFQAALAEAFVRDVEKGRPTLPTDRHFPSPAALAEKLAPLRAVVEFGNPFASPEAELFRVEGRLTLDGAPNVASVGAELFEKWASAIQKLAVENSGSVILLAHHDEQMDRIKNLLGHRSLNAERTPSLLAAFVDQKLTPGAILIGKGDLASHAFVEGEGGQATLVLPEHALFGARPRKAKPASQKLQNYLSSFADLKAGDLIVHVQHGIGRYQGMSTLTVAGVASDFLILEYASGDKVYLPVDRLNLLQRYNVGSEGAGSHALDKIGGPGWEKRKSRVKGAVKDMADELIKIQAKRALAKGFAFHATDDEYVKFEAAFPYEETEDQTRALTDVDADLLSGRPMDRLVCGDVGFGKTEIALRAAMRAVLEGYQVLVLVPTTVLCYQHYRTFQTRLDPFGVRVAQVNRFVSSVELAEAVKGLEEGRVDVLIGTHRILSNDIKPKRLGLLVIDEEQRFGVAHKEKLKQVRAGAHVLTLTATPIPRTLHMAMVGLRDISIIATPPHDRLSVKTYISRFDEALIKEAIENEVRRGGQVFFVHNRVEDIEEIRLFLKTLVPHLEIRVGHGQMREHQLEKVIVDFLEQKFPILLCTTIIESGIDMPNVNTLIVDRADRYGLAQLYQLRGRVGRSNVQAYAYFLTPVEERLSEEGKKRLDVLAAYQDLGAGFQIASHDLELRGSGNLLGGEQSGHAAAVGLELYTQLLDGAIAALRGEAVEEIVDPEIKLPVSALIPPTYIAEERQRLVLYKQLFAAESTETLSRLKLDVEDRYGKAPPELALLLKVARLKQQLRQIRVQRLAASNDAFELRFAKLAETQIDSLIQIVAKQPDRYRLSPDYRLYLKLKVPGRVTLESQDEMLNQLISLVDPLVEKLATGS